MFEPPVRESPSGELQDSEPSVRQSPCGMGAPAPHSAGVRLDPDSALPAEVKTQFQDLLYEFDDVFDPKFKGYNGGAGRFQAVVNMGPVQPPQRKGRIPQYSRDRLVQLQQKFDELESLGVFARPEKIDVVVEYLNPSFLVKKPNGGFRLVTAFTDVGRYSKPQPALMPDVESTLREIAQWKHIIVMDLTSAFYQIPLSKPSMKYCGVVTPFRGVRVYRRSAMGMPGSETALEELMCRVLGDLRQEGIVAKLADDLYCGGNTHEELLQNWRRVLAALHGSDLRLSASKTVVCPKTTTILGWIWSQGSIKASPHRISTLASCDPPQDSTGLRSYIGAYKTLAKVMPRCADIVAPLDDAISGMQPKEKLVWTDELLAAFDRARKFLSSSKPIAMPQPGDQLWIVTDAAKKTGGLGATLYVSRNGKPRLAGYFSAKLRKHQVTWLPCELEALSIAAAIKHFSPYMIQSENKTCVLTDSKPCVQAFEKMCRGEFSASPRVSAFLSAVSRYQASLRHLAGSSNIPSDFASRNAQDCVDPGCQVCSFIAETQESVVRHATAQDVLQGLAKLPFTGRSTWLQTQSECPDLRRTHAHLVQGTRPSKKETNIRDVKRYLNVATVARDGLLVVGREEPLVKTSELIIVPRRVLDGLLVALHIRLSHPSSYQLKAIVRRYFYALDLDRAVDRTAASCHHCASLRQVPHTLAEQSTGDPCEVVGVSFATDVLRRERQLILVLRETVTSYTGACMVESEQHSALREALIQMCIPLRPLDGPFAVVRTDPAPGFMALVKDELLAKHRICIEVGRVKNQNKNPVAERAVQELERELLKLEPMGGPVTQLDLTVAVANLNTRVRRGGMSARELLMQRDQFTSDQLPLDDHKVILEQHRRRVQNHPYSERSKAPLMKLPAVVPVEVGDIVYLYSDSDKSRARSRYLVVSVDGAWCNVRKFAGSQLRSTSYRVKLSECFRVPVCGSADDLPHGASGPSLSDSMGGEVPVQAAGPPPPPKIPQEISLPLSTLPVGNGQGREPSVDTEVPDSTSPILDTSVSVPPGVDSGMEPVMDNLGGPRRSGRSCRMPRRLEDYDLGD